RPSSGPRRGNSPPGWRRLSARCWSRRFPRTGKLCRSAQGATLIPGVRPVDAPNNLSRFSGRRRMLSGVHPVVGIAPPQQDSRTDRAVVVLLVALHALELLVLLKAA